MKKLLLVAALGVAGLMSAKSVEVTTVKNSNSIEKTVKSMLVRDYDWVTVTTGCGKVFFLDNNMYDGCYECLQEDARKFTDAQCGSGAGFELPF